jgi:DNA polymerase elongation subunit (family B)
VFSLEFPYLKYIVCDGDEGKEVKLISNKNNFLAPEKPYFFVPSNSIKTITKTLISDIIQTELKAIDTNERVSKIITYYPALVKKLRKNFLRTYEADIPFVRRIMIDYNYRCLANYKKLYVDIEVDDSGGFPNILKADKKILCIGAMDEKDEYYFFNSLETTEEDMLEDFRNFVDKEGYLLCTWSSFDNEYLNNRLKKLKKATYPFEFLDIYATYRHNKQRQLESFKLEDVAREEGLTEAKKEKEKPVYLMNLSELGAYNKNDCKLLKFIDTKTGLSKVYNKIAYLTHTFPSDILHISVAVDSLLLEKARKLFLVLPTKPERKNKSKVKGAFVLKPSFGLFENVAYLDFASMYPNLIIAYRISPDKEKVLYPLVASFLLQEREKAKKSGDEILEKALKKISNALYGVLGLASFRLYNPLIQEEITFRGRTLIQKIIKGLEAKGYKVIYSDTDSIFVKASEDSIEKVINCCKEITNNPFLNLKLEAYFKKVLFVGKKKKYVGWEEGGEAKIVGFEAVRSDWFKLAKLVQKNVLKLIYLGKQEQIYSYLAFVRDAIFTDKFPLEYFVISKGLTKDIKSYKVEARHVKVAKQLAKSKNLIGEKVQYLETKEGAIPYNPNIKVKLNYEWYWKSILRMVARFLPQVLEHPLINKQTKLVVPQK